MKKFFLLIFVLVLVILIYFVYPIIKNRYFESDSKKIEFVPKDENSQEGADEPTDQVNIPDKETASQIDTTGTLPNVSAKDCDNKCQNFKDNTKNLTYCQEVCGLAPAKNDTDCENKTSLEKDYCLKGLGIAKKDFKLCDQIQDAGVKKTCKDRITEDIIESQ